MDVEVQKRGVSRGIKSSLLLFELCANSEYPALVMGAGRVGGLSFAFTNTIPAGPVDQSIDS